MRIAQGTCIACGAAVPEGDRACPACGEPVRAGERKLATLLFADLSGYTALAGALDPEEVFGFLRPTMTQLRLIVEQHGGSVPQVMGDGFLAVFGAPLSHEDDAERAVRAALALVAHIAPGKGARNSRLEGLSLHAGVNTGEVMVAPSREPSGFAVIGDAVNVAARIAELAPGGHVLVGETTEELTRHAIRYGPRQARSVKGKSHNIGCFEALAVLSPTPVVHVTPRGGGAFVGRGGTLRQLAATLRDVRESGRSAVLLVTGEPGLGKTRLAKEFVRQSGDVISLWGNCHPYGQELPLSALAEALRLRVGIAPDVGPSTGRRLLSDYLAGLVGAEEAATLTGELALHLGLEAKSSAAVSGTLEAAAAIRSLLREEARDRPVLVTLDDVQWAQPELVEMLETVDREPWHGAILFLLLGRPEVAIALPGVERIEIAALPKRETVQLVKAAFGELAETVVERLVARAGGNPLFLEESARVLVETGALVSEEGNWRLSDPSATEVVPASIRLLIAARIDGLDIEEKAVLRDAAVAGQRASGDLLEHLSGSAVEETLSRLEGRDLLRRRSSSLSHGVVEFEFKHELIRDVAYDSIPRLVRADRHRRIAEWMEQRRGRPHVALLAHHWAQAWRLAASRTGPSPDPELARRAATWYASWGEQTIGHSPRLATDLFSTGVDLAEQSDAKAVPQLLARLLVGEAQCRIELGRHRGAIAAASRARALATRAGDDRLRASALLALGRAYSNLSEVQRARVLLQQALRLYEATEDLAGQARTVQRLAETYRFKSHRRQVALYDRAQALYADSGERWERALLALDLAYLLTVVGGKPFRERLSVAERIAHVAGLRAKAALLRTRAYHAYYAADYPAALELVRRARPLAVEAGERWVEVDALLMEALILGAIGPASEAERLARQVREIARDVGARHLEGLSLMAEARPAQRLGSPVRATRRLRAARELLGGLGVDAEMAEVDLAEAWLLLERGAWSAVEAPARAAELRARRHGWTLFELQALLTRALASLGSGRLRRGRTQLEATLVAARTSEASGIVEIATAALQELLLLNGGGAMIPSSRSSGNPLGDGFAADAEVLAALREGRDASILMSRAAAAWARLGSTAWQARSLAWQAAVLRRARREAAAAESTDEATRVLRTLHAPIGALKDLALPRR